VAGGVYGERKKMKALFVADQIGGQSVVSNEIENWIGETKIAGFMLAKKLREHLENYKNEIDIKFPARAEKIEKQADGTFLVTIKGEKFATKTILFCTGGRHRHLEVKGEKELTGKGVSFCATCDAPFFREQNVAVVGGGNSALEAVEDLLKYAQKVYLIVRKSKEEIKGDATTLEEILKNEKVEIITYSAVQEIYGEKMMTGLRLKNLQTAG
jgi:alkyl hydroperoxide reductase subunit F